MAKRMAAWTLPALVISIFFASYCHRPNKESSSLYYSLSDTARYAGMQACRGCHADVYESYIKTGMGQSFHYASKSKSAAGLSLNAVYDSIKNFYYKPYWMGDSLFVDEFRLAGDDTVYKRTEKVSYIIGSGQHTNSHLCSFNGYLFQAPITFYTQKRQWDFAPGFEEGYNSRFTRPVALECMTCHNGLPTLAAGSVNKYVELKTGIDCERCHGPGAGHVRLKQAGVLVDTATQIDYSIVNPRDLPRDLQMSLCQRCHLQGLAVLRKGKSFDQFKPGMNLSEVWDVFLPEAPASRGKFIMASQAERLRMSRCYIQSDMSCITCHHPHISVKETPVEVFNNKCQRCHQEKSCTESMAARQANNDDCCGCHMPKSGSIDIPHVFITDHYIRKNNASELATLDSAKSSKVKEYLRLKCFTRQHPPASTMAEAYLSFYEKFSPREYLLDSAASWLFGKAKSNMPEETIHYYYLKKDYNNLVAAGNSLPKDSVYDAWTYYRIGEAHYALGNFVPAATYFRLACEQQPLHAEFQNKLGASLTHLGKYDEAKSVFRNILNEQPKFEAAWSNLGFLLMREGNLKTAEQYFDNALALNPDYEQALVNKVSLYMNTGRIAEAKKLALRITELSPNNVQAKLLLQGFAQHEGNDFEP